jgi:hypothetical protein
MTAAARWGRRSVTGAVPLVVGLVATSLLGLAASANDKLTFVAGVKLKPVGVAQLAGAPEGTLYFKVIADKVELRLANVPDAGAKQEQELRTQVRRVDFGLLTSRVDDVVAGKTLREMKRKQEVSLLDQSPNAKPVDVFEFRLFTDSRSTVTEPVVEHRVVDFISAIMVAADAVARPDKTPQLLSMLRDRSITNVVMTVEGAEPAKGNRPAGVRVRVASPADPTKGGIVYVIAQDKSGHYYPALISIGTSAGQVEIEGSPE